MANAIIVIHSRASIARVASRRSFIVTSALPGRAALHTM
jgi:hypothetical protein